VPPDDDPSRTLDRHASPSRGGWHSAEAETCFLPRSCFLAPSTPLLRVTLAAYLHKMKFEKQVLDRHGPAQVGSNHHCGGLTVYCGKIFVLPRLSSWPCGSRATSATRRVVFPFVLQHSLLDIRYSIVSASSFRAFLGPWPQYRYWLKKSKCKLVEGVLSSFSFSCPGRLGGIIHVLWKTLDPRRRHASFPT
jgi:hypothetical protein